MRAITFHAEGEVRVESVPDPRIVDPGDAIVRVERTAVCGSDLHVYHGRETGLDQGCVMGHEFLGEVVEAGADAGVPVGTRVVSPFTTSCGGCFHCRSGLTSRCSRGQIFGWVEEGAGLHGAQAELVRVPLAASSLVAVPDDVDPDAALLVGDVLATGWHCAANGDVGPGKVVAVIGCGPVGLLATVAALELGAERVFAVDGVDRRRELATGFGGTGLDAGDAAIAAVLEATDGRGADVVLEAVGGSSGARSAVDMVRAGGVISSVGVQTEDGFAFSPIEAYDKNLTLRFGRCPARHYAERLLDWLRETRVETRRGHRQPSDAARRRGAGLRHLRPQAGGLHEGRAGALTTGGPARLRRSGSRRPLRAPSQPRSCAA